MERKQAHHALISYVEQSGPCPHLRQAIAEIDAHLRLPPAEREYGWEALGARLARLTAEALLGKMSEMPDYARR
jgi:hypothetical protein